jgi:arylsulfatase A-like enzyme
MAKHLLITIDDAGKSAVESFAQEIGALHVPATPNLAALEAKGVRFGSFFVNPVCSPTRALLMTGQYAFRSGIGDNCQFTLNGPPGPTTPMLPKALANHDRALVGKWHLATQDNGDFTSYSSVGGFDTWRSGVLGNVLFVPPFWRNYFYWDKITDGVFPAPILGDTGNPPSPVSFTLPPGNDSLNRNPLHYNTTVTVDEALAWLSGRSSDWFMWVNFQAPHGPLHRPPSTAERAAAGLPPMVSASMEAILDTFEMGLTPPGWETSTPNAAAYLAMCEALDHEIGRLLAAPEIDVDTDTWVWFLSDNGQDLETLEPPFTSGKNETYDLGTNVPFVVSGPRISGERGNTCRRLAHATDVFRTICEIEGVSLAGAFPGATFDGVDLRPLFTNVRAPGPRTFAYVEKFSLAGTITNPVGGIQNSATGATNDPAGHTVGFWDRAILDEEWKLRTLMPTGPASTLGDVATELYRHQRRGPRTQPAYDASAHDIEAAAAAADRLRQLEEALLP